MQATRLTPEARCASTPTLEEQGRADGIYCTPLPTLGARLYGLRTCASGKTQLTADEAYQVRLHLREHGLLIIRGEDWTHEGLLSLAGAFCPRNSLSDPDKAPQFDKANGGIEGYPMLRTLGTTNGSVLSRLGYEWHVDSSDLTILHCVLPPEEGGDTLFVSTRHLYESLSPEYRREAEGLKVVYSNQYTAGGPAAIDSAHGLRMSPCGTMVVRAACSRKPAWQLGTSPPIPLVLKWNGKPTLVAATKNVDHVEGLGHEESKAYIDRILRVGLQPTSIGSQDDDLITQEPTVFGPNVMTHRWQKGDIVLWDNSAVLHSTSPVVLYKGDREMIQLMFSADLMENNDNSIRAGWLMNARAQTQKAMEERASAATSSTA